MASPCGLGFLTVLQLRSKDEALLRDSHVSHTRGKCLTLYDSPLEVMATWIFQGSTKAPPKLKVRKQRFYLWMEGGKVEEEHLGPQITLPSL